MTRLVVLALVVFTVQACGRPHPRPVRVAPATAISVDSASTPVASTDDMTPAVRRRAIQVANQAAARVDAIVVNPDSLVLHVGQTIPVYEAFTIEGRDSTGAFVALFAPALQVEDHTVAQLTGSGLVGRHPGTTHLMIRTYSSDPSITVKPIRVLVAIRVER